VETMNHISEDALERYAMQALPQSQIGPLEEHILTCPECRVREQAANEYVEAIKWALARMQRRRAS
jgi:anti-sigma factor RsiW